MLRLALLVLGLLVCTLWQGRPAGSRSQTAPVRVVVFLATDCPIAGRFARPIQRLAHRFGPRGVAFSALFPNASESVAGIESWCRERAFVVPSTRDVGGVQAKRFAATVTPEVVVLDRSGKVAYQGRIAATDDPRRVDSGDLALAVTAAIENRVPAPARTVAFGCAIHANPARAATADPNTPTWSRDVAPILFKHCVPCHRTGEVGPMALDQYDKAARFAIQIAEQTARRTMPPWQADSHGEFHDERRLSDLEIWTLGRWARAGAPSGAIAAAPKPPPPSGPDGWKLGKPDAEYALEAPYVTPPDGKDHYRCFVFPNRADADQWIEGIEFLPGAKGSVHHVSAFVDMSGAARKLDAADPGPGYTNPTPGNGPGFAKYVVIGGWTPGHLPRRVPAGAGLPLPRGADIVMEVHYHLTGKAESDRTRCALHFARGPVDKQYRVGDVGSIQFTLPAGKKDAVVEANYTLNADITIHSVTPHLHLLGRQMRVTAETPEGKFIKIIDIVRWDFGWQPSYRFRKPIQLPLGTRIDVRAVYDNSADNPDNPNRPPKDVAWGEGIDAEMCSVFFGYTLDKEQLTSPR